MGKKMSSPQIANRWTLLRNVSISCERYGMIIVASGTAAFNFFIRLISDCEAE